MRKSPLLAQEAAAPLASTARVQSREALAPTKAAELPLQRTPVLAWRNGCEKHCCDEYRSSSHGHVGEAGDVQGTTGAHGRGLDRGHIAVNQKILVKIWNFWRGFYPRGRHRTLKER